MGMFDELQTSLVGALNTSVAVNQQQGVGE